MLYDPERIDDDVLALIFISCHPVLSREASVALTLRVLGGLTSDEIARAFVTPDRDRAGADHPRQEDARRGAGAVRGAAARRAPRAAQLGAQRHLPDLHRGLERHLGQRAGSAPTSPARRSGWPGCWRGWCRTSPRRTGCSRCSRLTAARFPARVRRRRRRRSCSRTRTAAAGTARPSGAVARRWPRAGRVGRGLGAYGLQASIAECHAVAPSVEETDWERIVLLYDALGSPRALADRRPQPRRRRLDGPRARRRRCRSSTRSSSRATSAARTCCPASAASCSSGSAAPTRPAPSWRPPYGCARTSVSGRCCRASSTGSGEPMRQP